MALLLNTGNTVSRSYTIIKPSPTHPIQPSECGERTANLWDGSYTGISSSLIYKPMYVGSGDFTLSSTIPNDENNIRNLFFLSGNVSSGASSTTNGVALGFAKTVSSVDGYVTIAYRSTASGNPNSPTDYDTMLNTGSTALPYEPYGYKIPILNNSQTTNVYLGEVQTTRKIKKLVLTGQESGWTRYAPSAAESYLYYLTGLTTSGASNCICTHVPYKSYVPNTSYAGVRMSDSRTTLLLNCGSTTIANNTVEDFKAWLQQQYAAGTPVCVWYVLAEPTTGIVNEPIRKIGDYADEVSGITIPTIAGANTLSIGTTLQPSEVTVNYKGWHPVADVHEYEDGNDNYIPDLNTLTTTVSNCVIESVSNNTLVLSGNGYIGSSFSQIISNDVMIPSNLIGKTVTLSGSITWSSEGNIAPRVTIMMHRSGGTDYNVSIYQGAFTQTFEVPSDAISYALLFRIDQNRSEYVGTARVTYTNIELKEQPHWN